MYIYICIYIYIYIYIYKLYTHVLAGKQIRMVAVVKPVGGAQCAGAGARAREITRADATGTTETQEGEGPTRDRPTRDHPAQGDAPTGDRPTQRGSGYSHKGPTHTRDRPHRRHTDTHTIRTTGWVRSWKRDNLRPSTGKGTEFGVRSEIKQRPGVGRELETRSSPSIYREGGAYKGLIVRNGRTEQDLAQGGNIYIHIYLYIYISDAVTWPVAHCSLLVARRCLYNMHGGLCCTTSSRLTQVQPSRCTSMSSRVTAP